MGQYLKHSVCKVVKRLCLKQSSCALLTGCVDGRVLSNGVCFNLLPPEVRLYVPAVWYM